MVRYAVASLWASSVFLILCGTARAGAWTLPAGEWEMHNSLLYYTSDEFFNERRNRDPISRYDKVEFATYGEYGWDDTLTLGGNVALNATTTQAANEWNHGISDPEFFARKRLWKGDSAVFSLQPLVKLPSVSRDSRLPRSGTREWDAELRLLGGTSFQWINHHHYFDAGLAYRKRFGDLADQVRFDLTLGLRATEKLTIMPQLFTTWRLEEPNRSDRAQIFENDYNLVKPQLSAVYALTESSALQGGFFHDVYGKNSGQGSGVFISTWHKF